MKKKKLSIFLAGMAVVMITSGSVLFALPETEVTNHFTTGVVDIDLKEYQISEGKEVAYEDVEHILPGQTISKIPRIHNAGNACYVRVKLSLEGTEEEIEIEGMGEEWLENEDGYYYYKDVLETGDVADVFQSVKIPPYFSQEEEEGKFRLKIDADAIQSENFKPNFEESNPWGEVEIQECKKEGEYDITTFKQADSQSLLVEYQGNTGKLIAKPDDFFVNFPVLLPGDSYKDSVELANTSNVPIKLYFKSAVFDDELLEKMTLRITTQINDTSKTVYEGNLQAGKLEENQLLGVIPSDGSGKFEFEISVPAELDNEYTVLANQVKWIFSTEPIGEVLTEVQTGLAKKTGLFLLLSGVALGSATIILYRKGRKHEASGDNSN